MTIPNKMSAIICVEFGLAKLALAFFISSNFVLSLSKFEMISIKLSPSHKLSAKHIAAFCFSSDLALWYWWLFAACGYGINIEGTAHKLNSDKDNEPARATTKSALAKYKPISSK